jgi:hypothetical protein
MARRWEDDLMLIKLNRASVSALATFVAVAGLACKSPPPTENEPGQTVTNTNATVTKKVDPLANVANRDQLMTDPNAEAVDPPKSAALLTGYSTSLRKGPRGETFETLETTANVKEIQRDGDYFLVTYPDPKGSGKTLAGWVYKDSIVGEGSNLTPGMPRNAGKLDCPSGNTHVRTTRDFCAKTCKQDSTCDTQKGELCDGIAFEVNEKKNEVTNTRICILAASEGRSLPGGAPRP